MPYHILKATCIKLIIHTSQKPKDILLCFQGLPPPPSFVWMPRNTRLCNHFQISTKAQKEALQMTPCKGSPDGKAELRHCEMYLWQGDYNGLTVLKEIQSQPIKEHCFTTDLSTFATSTAQLKKQALGCEFATWADEVLGDDCVILRHVNVPHRHMTIICVQHPNSVVLYWIS